MFCTSCGKEIKEGALFCQNCGKKINIYYKSVNQKKEVNNKGSIKTVFDTIGFLLLGISVLAYIIVPELGTQSDSWSFYYGWGSSFYMLDFVIFLIGFISIVIGVILSKK